MKHALILLSLLVPAAAQAGDGPKTVNARDTVQAASMEVDDSNTMICVRKPVIGSRTKMTKDCRTSAAWKAHRQEVEAAGWTINKT